MPKAFTDCVKNGGRVRTKKLDNEKYIHICYLNGKSYAGETKQSQEEADVYLNIIKGGDKMGKFTENIAFNILEGNIDEEKRTVRVCALAPCVSRNGRFYSPKVVESVAGTLKGKKSFADHDDRNTKNLIGRIVNEEWKDGRLYADIKISKSKGIAQETLEKIIDGTITDVSIAANGQSRRVKLGEQIVDEVTALDINSVDFVTEGGVADAKVMHVYENVNDIPKISEVKKEMTIEELKKDFPELVESIEKPLKDAIDAEKKLREEAEAKLSEKAVSEYRESKIVALEAKDNVKDLLRKRVVGKTNEEVDESITKELAVINETAEALKVEAKVKGVADGDTQKQKEDAPKEWSRERIMNEALIPEAVKNDAYRVLVEDGSKAMLDWLKEVYSITL